MAAARPIWTLDCETDPFKPGRIPHPFIFGLYEGVKDLYHEFVERHDAPIVEVCPLCGRKRNVQCSRSLDVCRRLLEYLNSRYASEERPLIYAHNGGKFDYHYLRDGISSDQPLKILNGRLAQFWIGECELRDSLNIFTQTKLGQFSGKIEIDYAKMEWDVRALHMDEIRAYQRQDCVMLYENLARYFKEYGRAFTQAGASMRYWSKKSGRKRPCQSATTYELLKPWFYGGRVQCFEHGYKENDPVTVVDLNSAYPRAMCEEHPFSTEPVALDHLPDAQRVPQCLIRLDAISRGALPYRTERGELYYPDDFSTRTVREYHVTGWEFLTALELDCLEVVRIKLVYYFPESVNFKEYVGEFWQKRKDAKACADKAADIFAKIFMNSLFGKFASDPERFREWVIASDESLRGWIERGYRREDAWGVRHLLSRPMPEEKQRRGYYNLATAASITGYVRAQLFRSIQRCRGVLYCDTDSITARDVSRLDKGKELGQWKVEYQCDAWAIAGKKMYALRTLGDLTHEQMKAKGLKEHEGRAWKVAHKGVDLAPAELIALAQGEKVDYRPAVPTYSLCKAAPVFIDRSVRRTAKDISKMPETG